MAESPLMAHFNHLVQFHATFRRLHWCTEEGHLLLKNSHLGQQDTNKFRGINGFVYAIQGGLLWHELGELSIVDAGGLEHPQSGLDLGPRLDHLREAVRRGRLRRGRSFQRWQWR